MNFWCDLDATQLILLATVVAYLIIQDRRTDELSIIGQFLNSVGELVILATAQ